MSEKPVVNPQECDPRTLGLARKPRPAVKKKPGTEVVVQLGPFTDGQITAPEMVRPLEGPTEWLIKPNTGEIVPFDAGTPPEKDVIRKYITVGAQDTDVPEDLPKIADGYVVERVRQEPLPTTDYDDPRTETRTVRVVENEGPASVECNTPPGTPVNENEEPGTPTEHECPPCEPCPPPPPPVDEQEDCDPPPTCPPVDEQEDCDPPTTCPPVDEQEDCDPPPTCPPVDEQEDCDPPPTCPPVNEQEDCEVPVDAVDDCATTKAGCKVVIDVLHNDKGCELEITGASAEHGEVEIRAGKLHYTPNDNFSGNDVITYTVGDEHCMNDTAHVYMSVTPLACPPATPNDCGSTQGSDCVAGSDNCSPSESSHHMKDYEYSSSPYKESLFSEHMDRIDEFLSDKMEHINNLIQAKSSWASHFSSANSIESAACTPVEEPAAAC